MVSHPPTHILEVITGGSSKQNILFRVVQRVKDLGLDGVEVREAVELLELWIPECGHLYQSKH